MVNLLLIYLINGNKSIYLSRNDKKTLILVDLLANLIFRFG